MWMGEESGYPAHSERHGCSLLSAQWVLEEEAPWWLLWKFARCFAEADSTVTSWRCSDDELRCQHFWTDTTRQHPKRSTSCSFLRVPSCSLSHQ
jgi:hypothetical protein